MLDELKQIREALHGQNVNTSCYCGFDIVCSHCQGCKALDVLDRLIEQAEATPEGWKLPSEKIGRPGTWTDDDWREIAEKHIYYSDMKGLFAYKILELLPARQAEAMLDITEHLVSKVAEKLEGDSTDGEARKFYRKVVREVLKEISGMRNMNV